MQLNLKWFFFSFYLTLGEFTSYAFHSKNNSFLRFGKLDITSINASQVTGRVVPEEDGGF